uniref:Uncharacterized protein n=1 Tax=Brassica oleracea TaxID=3712 RepID=A0A3P6C703_BRAOL|nr:unnamed protein product [Brassica oleracea]
MPEGEAEEAVLLKFFIFQVHLDNVPEGSSIGSLISKFSRPIYEYSDPPTIYIFVQDRT